MIIFPSFRRLAVALACVGTIVSSRAEIESVTRTTRTPLRYERVDFTIILKAKWSDPFRSDDVRLDFDLTAPSGRHVVVPAYLDDGESGESSVWRVRYAPGETGEYHGTAVLVSHTGRETATVPAFTVAPSSKPGFLHPAGPWIFRFDNGEPFRGLGEDMCWESRSNDDSRFFKPLHENLRFNYGYLFGSLQTHGGNFARVWMCPWNLPLEWKHVGNSRRYADSPEHFNPSAIARMDRFVETAEAAGIYVMLALDSHASLLGGGWAHSNYNVKNGGPAATPEDFFTNAGAKAQYKDRLRYIIARWGYSPNIAALEFFNEVDNAMYGQKPNRIPDDVVTAWHGEMSAYLKQLDPYGHLVTTSISHRDVAGLDELPAMDFNQKHIYRNTAAIPGTIREYLAKYGKPYVIGEFGYEWDWTRNFNDFADKMDRDYRDGLWLGLFSPTPIIPMSWWWEFFDQRGTIAYIGRVRPILDAMLRAGQGDFETVAVEASTLEPMAVRCGSETFVYLHNTGTAATNTTLDIPGRAGATSATCSVYDPATGQTTPGPQARVERERITLGSLSVAPDQTLIVILR